jgi:uncharacterized membrane protein YdjX (TVP38/TMEM64 family)
MSDTITHNENEPAQNHTPHSVHASSSSINQNPLHDEIEIAEPEHEPRASMRQLIFTGLGFIIFITVVTLAINAIGIDEMQNFIAQAGILAPLAYIAIKALTYVVAPLTSGPIQVFAGALFGNVWLGVIYTLIGEVIGGSVSFFIARRFGRPVVQRLVGKEGIKQIDDFYENKLGGWRSLAIARIVLFSVWDFLSYACGLTPIRYRTYFLVSAILGFFPTLFFVALGQTLVEDASSLFFVYALVAVMIVAPIVFRKQVERLLNPSSNGNSKQSTTSSSEIQDDGA